MIHMTVEIQRATFSSELKGYGYLGEWLETYMRRGPDEEDVTNPRPENEKVFTKLRRQEKG